MKVFKQKKLDLIVLDIGTEFLKVLLLEIKDKKGTLKNWVKESLNKIDKDNLEEVFLICNKVINKLQEKSGIKTRNIFLGMNNDFVKGISINSCFKREKPDRKINLIELKKFVQRLQWNTFDKISKSIDSFDEKFKIIDTQIVDIKIDNESINNPLGFKGKSICLTIFSIYAFNGFLNKLSLFSDFNILGISSCPYALFSSLDLEDALIIDIGGKSTEITLIKDNIINTKSFDLAGHTFTKELADLLNIRIDEAERIKTKGMKNRKIQKLFNSIANSWFNGIKVILDDYGFIPSNIYFCGGDRKSVV